MREQVHKIEVSAKTIVFAVVLLILLQVIWVVRELFYSFVTAFIVMSAFNPAVSWLSRFRVPRALSAVFFFGLLITAITYLFMWLVPPVSKETAVLVKNLPKHLSTFSYGPQLQLNENFFSQYVTSVTGGTFDFLKSTFSNVIFLISTVFFSFYFLLEERSIKAFFVRFMDKKNAPIAAVIIDKMEARMQAWLWGQLILMISIGVTTYIGLLLLGVKYPLPLAVLAGLLEVVPIIGPIISAIPAFLVTASQSWVGGMMVIGLYFIIQQVENQVLVPVIMRRAVGLSPIITLAALIIGGKLAGIMGVLLAVPITLGIETILTELSNLRKD